MTSNIQPIFSLLLVLFFSLSNIFPANAISIIEEKKVAKEFMKMVESSKSIIHDPIVTHMTRSVAERILEHLPDQPFEYHFYVIQDDTFNAFASPASNIFINTGLIASLETVDELAGVIAHEIAHAASRHVSQSIDRSKIVSAGTLAGVLAGILIGSKSDEDLGQSITIGSMALGQSAMLSFTRENETEADQKGLTLLQKSCFSPEGLLSGLIKIRAADWKGVEGIPDYFKTHPGTKSRIAHLVSLMENQSLPPHRCTEDFRYDMIRNRIIGIYANADKAQKTLTSNWRDDPDNPAINYGLALVLARKSRVDEAISHLKTALKSNPFDPLVLLEIGRLHLLEGNPSKALAMLRPIEFEPVVSTNAAFLIARAQLESGKIGPATKGFEKVIYQEPDAFPRAYYHLAESYSLQKEPGLSHYYLGMYYTRIHNRKNAVFHYKKAVKTLKDSAKADAAKEKIKQLEKEMFDEKRKSAS
ncbi:MAG: Zn-dependent protease [Desulfobacteraceae bacterium]|nr:MAG: Zn-dependent protease [Desulfobacteraceae bacterium]